mmetsp:Transcript_23657/g.75954  ORF Transcript_23657/g.75954 Transcript_23657/m.75954 type:complete len:277 (-) Transcript_23657:346-1176(-)
MALHNKFVDLGASLQDAKESTIREWQALILSDLLPSLLDGGVLGAVASGDRKLYVGDAKEQGSPLLRARPPVHTKRLFFWPIHTCRRDAGGIFHRGVSAVSFESARPLSFESTHRRVVGKSSGETLRRRQRRRADPPRRLAVAGLARRRVGPLLRPDGPSVADHGHALLASDRSPAHRRSGVRRRANCRRLRPRRRARLSHRRRGASSQGRRRRQPRSLGPPPLPDPQESRRRRLGKLLRRARRRLRRGPRRRRRVPAPAALPRRHRLLHQKHDRR